MFIEESLWIKSALNSIASEKLSPLLNIGSSSADFRKTQQPFIHTNIFEILEERNIKILHTDLQNVVGVDLVGDLADDKFIEQLKQNNFKSVICSNLFEHLEEPIRLKICNTINVILSQEGFIVLTVPHIYPYHEDPIDTWYRPTTEELAKLFPSCSVVLSNYIKASESYYSELQKRPKNLLLSIIKLCIPFYKFNSWKNDIKYLPHWFKKYEVSCLILQKNK